MFLPKTLTVPAILALFQFLQLSSCLNSPLSNSNLVKSWIDAASNSGPEFLDNLQQPGYEYFQAKLRSSAESFAKSFARANNFEYVGKLGMLPDRFVFKRDIRSANKTNLRKRSDILSDPSVLDFDAAKPAQLLKRRHVLNLQPRDWRSSIEIKDPLFPKQWHLVNDFVSGNDINVTGVWEMGVTGRNVTVALIDDGLDYTSEDLTSNFNYYGSYDFNDNTKLPTPRLGDDYHGTRCAGQISAIRNDVCGVGVAYDSKVSGIRMLSGPVSELIEVRALNYQFQINDIYSCSWGPTDDGATVQAPTKPMVDAFINGVQNGRNGKGNVFVFATGNGGRSGDNCNFDGYTNSIYTISIGAIDYKNAHPDYSEACSAQLAVTYSSGGGKQIATSDLGIRSCTEAHGGTSAAAPLAAGIFALVLSVRPDLSWRDVQQLIVETAVPVSTSNTDWDTVANGRKFNHMFGFGKLDSYAIVKRAMDFDNLAKQTSLVMPVVQSNLVIPAKNSPTGKEGATSSLKVDFSAVKKANLKSLEHVTVKVKISHTYRGNIAVTLISPSGVKSVLATPRPQDALPKGLDGWTFMSVKHWGGPIEGEWKLNVRNDLHDDHTGTLENWEITFFGESYDTPPKKQPPIINKSIGEDSAKDKQIIPSGDNDLGGGEKLDPPNFFDQIDENGSAKNKPTITPGNSGSTEANEKTFTAPQNIYVGFSKLEFIAIVSITGVLILLVIFLTIKILSKRSGYTSASWSAIDNQRNVDGLLFQDDNEVDHPDDAFEFFEMPETRSRDSFSEAGSNYDTNDETNIGSSEYTK
ncbi:Protease KEX1 [Smittium mucronatum]|uniref:Protease KEX1 n=1 Tax=Smittium mucronatum TaxID=133383 RepID=A0A1R0GRJ1_9FUNG|nr:Protease KEX1 [Smittium mucronatum]